MLFVFGLPYVIPLQVPVDLLTGENRTALGTQTVHLDFLFQPDKGEISVVQADAKFESYHTKIDKAIR